jgi:hypothetical protein
VEYLCEISTGKMKWGIGQIGVRESENSGLRERERMLVGKGFGVGLEMAISEIEHLSVLSNVNQQDKQLSIQVRVGPKFFE